MNNAKTTADEVEIARQPSLAPLLIVQTKAGKLTPFNLLPVGLANAALRLLWLAATPFHTLRSFGMGDHPATTHRLYIEVHSDDEPFTPHFSMYARPVVLWTDSWELVEQVRGYSQILTLIVTESADVAQQYGKISEAAGNIGLVYALESGGAYFPDLNLRIWREFIRTLHRVVPRLWPMRFLPDGVQLSFEETLAFIDRHLHLPIFQEMPLVQVSDDLIVRGSQIVLSFLRGQIPAIDWRHKPERPAELTRDLAREILATRVLLTLYSEAQAGDRQFFAIDAPKLLPPDFVQQIEDAASSVIPYPAKAKKIAALFTDMPVADLLRLSTRQLVLVCPSVSVVPGEGIRARASAGREVRFDALPEFGEGYGRKVLEAVQAGGRRLEVPEPQTPEDERLLHATMGAIKAETNFASAMSLFYALRFGSPVIKTERASDRLLRSLKALAEEFGRFDWVNPDAEAAYRRLRQQLTGTSKDITSLFPESYLDLMRELGTPSVHAFADFPLELLAVDGDYLGYRADLSRTPLTPGAISYTNYVVTEESAFLPFGETALAIVSPLDESDPEIEGFWSTLRRRFWKIPIYKVSTKEEFLKAVQSPEIGAMIYLGHGHYDTENDESGLELKNGWVGTLDIENVTRFPPLLALVGCNTATAGSTFGAMHAAILERGARLVIGTTFPIDKKVAALFLTNLLAELAGGDRGRPRRDLAEIVRETRQATRFRSDLLCFERRGVISPEDRSRLTRRYAFRLMKVGGGGPAASLELELELLTEAGLISGSNTRGADLDTIPYPLFFSVLGFPWTTYGTLFGKDRDESTGEC